MTRYTISILCVMLMCVALAPAQSDSIAYRAAAGTGNPSEKILALESFLKTFPSSRYAGNAGLALFRLYLDQGNEAMTLDAARRYLAALAPDDRMNPYNQIAYELATKNIGLDSALSYATRSSTMAQSSASGMLSSIEDTRAFVLYRLGHFAEAEQIQRGVMKGHEEDPEYITHLALYQGANGKRREALKSASAALYLASDLDLQNRFADWLRVEAPDSASREAMKQSIVMGTVRSHLESIQPSRAIAVRSTAARYMAATGVHLTTASQWAREAVESISATTPVEDAIAFKQNLAIVTATTGQYGDAMTMLRSVAEYITPWESQFWMALGSTCERAGDLNGAIEAYMSGLTVTSPHDLRQALEAVYTKVHGSVAGMDDDIEKVKQKNASVEPGKIVSEIRPGKTVLAELFTGAECGPCVSADLAFDALREYYPSSSLTILEYHEHIPGPDPLTNNDSWSRFQFYEGGGTPTVVVDGLEKIVGGGPKPVTRNRFNVYRYAIENAGSDKPQVRLSTFARTDGDNVLLEVRVGAIGGSSGFAEPVLHLALVERSVDYVGANGISKHAFVVRKLFYGPTGTPIALKSDEVILHAKTSLTQIDSDLAKILGDPKHQPSWPKRLTNFTAWKSHPEHLNRSNLGVVAWVQDIKTKKVLQATYVMIASGLNGQGTEASSGGD